MCSVIYKSGFCATSNIILLYLCCSGDVSETVVSSGQYDGHCPRYSSERVLSIRPKTDHWP